MCSSSCLVEGPRAPADQPVRHVRRFQPEPAACREVRRFIAGALAEAGVDPEVPELLSSELAANAVRYGGTAFTVVVSTTPIVRVEVHDGNAILPTLRAAGGEDEAGRGLQMLEALATRWGVDECRGGVGKAVWFELF